MNNWILVEASCSLLAACPIIFLKFVLHLSFHIMSCPVECSQFVHPHITTIKIVTCRFAEISRSDMVTNRP